MKTFNLKNPILGKMFIFLENFRPFFRVLRPRLGLNHPYLLTSTSTAKNYDDGESWDVFTKRLLVEKHISGIMYENPIGGHGPPCLPLPMPIMSPSHQTNPEE